MLRSMLLTMQVTSHGIKLLIKYLFSPLKLIVPIVLDQSDCGGFTREGG